VVVHLSGHPKRQRRFGLALRGERLTPAFWRVACCAWALLQCAPQGAWAWGAQGHRWIATLAQSQLSEAAQHQVEHLLALEPGATLASISTWADEVRTPATAAWHYVNLPPDAPCRYDPLRDCPDGACVVAAIQTQRQLLRSQATDSQRLVALKYLVHLVADVHQPLHAGNAQDRGGNRFQLQFAGRGTNLHALWDQGLIEAPAGGPAQWVARQPDRPAPARDPFEPASWAEESCRIVAQPWFYPASHRVDDAYVERAEPVLEQRLADAARRLAAVLNDSLVDARE